MPQSRAGVRKANAFARESRRACGEPRAVVRNRQLEAVRAAGSLQDDAPRLFPLLDAVPDGVFDDGLQYQCGDQRGAGFFRHVEGYAQAIAKPGLFNLEIPLQETKFLVRGIS